MTTATKEQIDLLGRVCYLRVRYSACLPIEGEAFVHLVDADGKEIENGVHYNVPMNQVIPGRLVKIEMEKGR